MVEAIQKKCMVVFVRHGERLDEVPQPGMTVEYSWDPPLTPHGLTLAVQAANLTQTFLGKVGYSAAPLTVVSSPHIRTIQTAAAF